MRIYTIAVLLGLLGMIAALTGWHLYVDHQTWHVLLNNIATQNAAQK